MSDYDEYIARRRAEHGEQFSEAGLAAKFVPYFNSGARIRVRTDYGGGEVRERTGVVSASRGRQPVFLLMHRSNTLGSSDTLSDRDEIVAVQRGRDYVEVTGA